MDEIAGRLCHLPAGIHINPYGVGRSEDRLRASDFLCRAVRHQQKAIGFHSRFVFDHAVLRELAPVSLDTQLSEGTEEGRA